MNLPHEDRRPTVMGEESLGSSVAVAAGDPRRPSPAGPPRAPTAQGVSEVVAGDGARDHDGREYRSVQIALGGDGRRQQDGGFPRYQQSDEGAGFTGRQDEHCGVRPPSRRLDHSVEVHGRQPACRDGAVSWVGTRASVPDRRDRKGTTRPCGSQASAGQRRRASRPASRPATNQVSSGTTAANVAASSGWGRLGRTSRRRSALSPRRQCVRGATRWRSPPPGP